MDIAAVPGVPETAVGPEVLDRLPRSAPPAPWPLELRALFWAAWPGAAPARSLPPSLSQGSRVLMGGGGFVRYLDTPVGPYCEALAAALLLRGRRASVHVPFIAVDSGASVVGGRTNWSLPKTLADFEGDPGAEATVSARGDGWAVRASARPLGPVLPLRARLALTQESPDGTVRRARGRLAGRARLAVVSVRASGGAELEAWLDSGRRLGVIVEGARGTLGAPE